MYVYVVLLVHACMRMRVCRCIPVVCPRLVTCLPLGVHHSVLVFASSAAPCEKEKGGKGHSFVSSIMGGGVHIVSNVLGLSGPACALSSPAHIVLEGEVRSQHIILNV